MTATSAARAATGTRKHGPQLLLFDIDGTLLDTQGAGLRAVIDALELAFHIPESQVPELELAGSTDSGILHGLFPALGIVMSEHNIQKFYQAYLHALEQELRADDFTGELLPGVSALLSRLDHDPRISLGLLTGNVETGARLKLQRFGLSHFFPTGAFGDDHEDRDHLGPIAVERMEAVAGHRFAPQSVTIVGDTPRDIACARALGARVLCVATGSYAAADLESHSPDLLLSDFSDVPSAHEKLSSLG